MKRRSLTVLLCLLAIISLASVGFASWVISAGDEVEETGNITVETVTDERLAITDAKLSGNDGNGHICFTAPSDTSSSSGWLKVGSHTMENLEATLTFKVGFISKKQVEYTNASKNITLEVDWAEATKAFLETAKNESLIKDIPDLDVLNDTLTFDSATSTFTVNIKFEWGSAFEGKNPFDFYNSKSVKDGYYTVGDKTYFKVTEETGVSYYEYEPTESDPYNKKEIAAPAEINEDNFTSWGDDANQKLSRLFEIFQGTTDENDNYKDKEYVIVIKADPVAQ